MNKLWLILLCAVPAFAGEPPVPEKSAAELVQEFSDLNVRVTKMAMMIADLDAAILKEEAEIDAARKNLPAQFAGEPFAKTKMRAEEAQLRQRESRVEEVKKLQSARRAVYLEARAELDALRLVIKLRESEAGGKRSEVRGRRSEVGAGDVGKEVEGAE